MLTSDSREAVCWHLLQTERGRERVAAARLHERGVQAYLPLTREWPKPVVGNAIQPLFPGYLFVAIELLRQHFVTSHTPGVRCFVMLGGEVACVDDGVIRLLRDREGPDGIIRCGWGCPDQRVRITAGPFRGLEAVIERRVPGRERVLVLFEFLQRRTRLELSERHLTRL
jgi:transcriptional antiterminator RfaH